MGKHANDMTREELWQLVFDMGSAALDLGQHLHFTNELLKHEYREEAYKRACKMAYEICWMPWDYEQSEEKQVNVIVLGEKGLERMDCNISDLLRRKETDNAQV